MGEGAPTTKRDGVVGVSGAGSTPSGISKVRSSRKVPASSSTVDKSERSSSSSRSSRNRSKRSSQSPATNYLAETKIAYLSPILEEVNKSKQSSPSPATNCVLETTTSCLSDITEEVNKTIAKSDTSCGHKCFNKATCKHACCTPTPAPVINGAISNALVSPLQKPTKPAPTFYPSCKHKCSDKATCRHLCCNITLRLIDLPRASDFIENDDMIACMVKFLPMEDLFLRVRHVSRMFKQTTESSEIYRKAAFLQAESPQEPSFRGCIKDALLDPEIRYDDTEQDRFDRGPYFYSRVDVPYRSLRVNPIVFQILPERSLADAVAAAGRYNLTPPDPRDYSKDGNPLRSELLLQFNAANNTRLNDDSSCMGMFLTQPPVNEILIHGIECAFIAGHYENPSTGYPGLTLFATDGEGLRYRDLYQHLNRYMKIEGVTRVLSQVSMLLPRCEALDHHGLPVLDPPFEY